MKFSRNKLLTGYSDDDDDSNLSNIANDVKQRRQMSPTNSPKQLEQNIQQIELNFEEKDYNGS